MFTENYGFPVTIFFQFGAHMKQTDRQMEKT